MTPTFMNNLTKLRCQSTWILTKTLGNRLWPASVCIVITNLRLNKQLKSLLSVAPSLFYSWMRFNIKQIPQSIKLNLRDDGFTLTFNSSLKICTKLKALQKILHVVFSGHNNTTLQSKNILSNLHLCLLLHKRITKT